MTPARLGEIVACSARVRSVSQMRGAVRVQILGPRELVVYAKRGAAEISYRGETETVPEGKTVRVLLNAEDDGQGTIAKKSGKRKMILVVATAAGAAAATIAAVTLTGRHSAMESPDRP